MAGTGPTSTCPQEAWPIRRGPRAGPGGGLYALRTPHGRAALCAEGMECGGLLVKELLCPPEDLDWVLERLPGLLPPVVLCLAHPRGLPPLRDAQVAGPGAGAVLGLGLHRLFGARI